MSKKIPIILLTIAFAFLALSTSAFATTRYVSAEGNDASAGTSWATAKLTLASVIATPVVAGDVVVISGGTYAGDFTLGVANITFQSSNADSTVKLTGAAAAGDMVTLATGGTSTTALTSFTNIQFDISGNTSKVAADAVITAATGVSYVKFYNCTIKGRVAAPVTTDLIEIQGAATNWIMENCTTTFGLAGTISNALSFKGAAAVTDITVIGSSFTGAGAGAIATDARVVNVVNTVTNFNNFYFGGNTVSKAGIVLNFDSATGLPAYSSARIYDNVFSQALAFTMIDATLGGGGADCWVNGQLLIKGNKFGSLTTNGNDYYAIMFDNFAGADINEANIFINNNNFQYPMTSGTDTNTNRGHVTANWTAGTVAGINAQSNYWGQVTGPLTAYEDKGVAVVNTDGSYDYTNWISTYSIPRIDETNRGIEIYDYDNDGYIDRAVAFFDQYLDPSQISYAGWSIASGYEFDTAKAVKLSIDNDGEGTPDGVFALTLFIKEKTSMDTGVKPDVTYAKASGIIAGITGNVSAKMDDIASATATEHDKAKPVVKSATTKDTGASTGSKANDGQIDNIVVVFSEAMSLKDRTAGTDADFDNNITLGSLAAGSGLEANGTTLADDTITIKVTETTTVTGDTGQKPTVAFAKLGSDDYVDAAGNYLNAVTKTSTDGAAPVAMIVETGDANADGYIDSFKITFSETMKAVAAADTAKIRTAFTAKKVENTLDFTTASVTVATNTVTIVGRSEKNASALGHPWDTDATPEVKYISESGIKDSNSSIAWVYFWDATAVKAVTTYPTTEVIDSAKPIIALATGQVNSKNLYVTFSEGVQGTGAAIGAAAEGGATWAAKLKLVVADMKYWNVYNTGLNATNITAISNDDASDGKITLTTDETILTEDVVADSVSVINTTTVMDFGGVNFVTPVVKVTINDVIAPTLVSAETQDVDNDGWIDHIKLSFSETLNDEALTGYNGGAKISLDTAIPNWVVAGYTVIGVNFVGSSSEQTTATTDATTRAIAFAADELGKVINVGDTASDEVLWLMVQEMSGTDVVMGDTDAIPALTITGDTAANVADFKPNRLATVTKTSSDKAGAALMDAAFTDVNKLQVWMSEAVADTLYPVSSTNSTISGDQLVSGDFSIHVGTFGNTVGATAKDVTQATAGIIDLMWIEAITTANNGGWIGLNASSIKDLANNSNTQNTGNSNNVGYKVITAYIPGGGTGSNAVTKATLNAVPANVPQINNTNVTRVKFAGTAGAGDSVAVKLVDTTGSATSEVGVMADATTGNFSGQIDASAMANGDVTLMAGKVDAVAGTVAWQTFADYMKETLTIGAPAGLAITDVANDNGGFVDVTFTKSGNDVGNTSDWYTVDYYVLQGKKGDDYYTVATLFVDGNADSTYRAGNVWVGTGITLTTANFRLNAHGKAGVGKAAADAPDAMSSAYVYADGSAADEALPGAFNVKADGSTGAGVVLTWTAPKDHGQVNLDYNIWGTDRYEVYRKVHGSTGAYVKVKTVTTQTGVWTTTGAFTATDNVGNGIIVYDYKVVACDGPVDDTLTQLTSSPEMLKVMASKGADFNGDGVVAIGDLVLLGQRWNYTPSNEGFVSNYDLNKDNKIAIGDVVILGQAWGTKPKVAKAVLPVITDVNLTMNANYDGKSSIYYVNIAASKIDGYDGLGFTLSYDADALELVKDGITGLGEVNITKEIEAGMVDINSYFMDNEFTGTITVAFQSKGMSKDLEFGLSDAVVSIDNALSAVNAAKVSVPAIPTVYSLNQNFPNPFNPTTTIEYSIPEAGNVNLVIYNLAGQKVRTLINENQPASFKKIVWDGRNDMGESVGAGIYFYKLVSGNFSKIQKMTLIK